MSRSAVTPPRSTGAPPARRSRRRALIGIVAAVLVGGGLVSVEVATSGRPSSPEASGFAASETVAVAGVTVDGSEIAMGEVPLDVTVTPAWTLTNTGDEPATLGQPHASVVEGCCPGQFTLQDTELAPGESTQLSFSLQMHEGMDGPHDFDVHVPIDDRPGAYLTLGVTGDFGGDA